MSHIYKNIWKILNLLNNIKMRVFLEKKNIEKKHLCRRDKNYYCFCKSVINLIVGSRNMIEV